MWLLSQTKTGIVRLQNAGAYLLELNADVNRADQRLVLFELCTYPAKFNRHCPYGAFSKLRISELASAILRFASRSRTLSN